MGRQASQPRSALMGCGRRRFLRGTTLILLAAGLAALPAVAPAADGSLDTSFDTDGRVITDSGGLNETATAVAIQTNGKIVVAGSSTDNNEGGFALARYNTDGSLDTSFDTDGRVITDFGGVHDGGPYDIAKAVAIQADGKIVAAGYHGDAFALARYNTDGSLDASFDTDGRVITNFVDSFTAQANAVAIQADGKIVAAGYHGDAFALARYDTDGSLDTSFDTDGRVITNFVDSFAAQANAVAIQADGKIVAAGHSYYNFNPNFALARYNTDGSLDTSFHADGMVITNFAPEHEFARAVAIQADGKIVAAGEGRNSIGTYWSFELVRFNSDGSLDTSFHNDGMAITSIRMWDDHASAVAIQADGKIVAAGNSENSTGTQDFALARYNTHGFLDTSFHADGMVITSFGDAHTAEVSAVAVQTDGKIVAAGYSDNGTDWDFALARYLVDDRPATSLSIETRSLVSKGTRVAVKGSLSSSDSSCTDLETVHLMKGSSVVSTSTTDPVGAYKFRLKITKKTVVRVVYDGTATCQPSTSAKRTIQVT